MHLLSSCALQMCKTHATKSLAKSKHPLLSLCYGSSRQSYYIHAKQSKSSRFEVAKIRITQAHFLKRKGNCFHILRSLWCSEGNHVSDSCCFSSQEATLWNESRLLALSFCIKHYRSWHAVFVNACGKKYNAKNTSTETAFMRNLTFITVFGLFLLP